MVGRCITRPSGRADLGLIVRPVPAASESGQAPGIAIFISDPEERSDAPVQVLVKLYGFTPTEALVAIHLANGLNIDEAAAELGMTRNTARAHRSVFSKTGISRQPALKRQSWRNLAGLRFPTQQQGLRHGHAGRKSGAGDRRGTGRDAASRSRWRARSADRGRRTTEGKLLETCAEIQGRGGRAVPIVCDAMIAADIERCVQQTVATLGPVDILINNAAVVPLGRLLDVTEEHYQEGMDSGPLATLRVLTCACRH
jgi:DNA-binding CsgD family transcriptional regulator